MKYCLTACSRSRCTEKADIYRVLWKAVHSFRRPIRADSVLGSLVLLMKIVAAAGQHERLPDGQSQALGAVALCSKAVQSCYSLLASCGLFSVTRLVFIQREETEFSAFPCCGEEESRFGRWHIPRCSFGCVDLSCIVALGRTWAQAAAAPAWEGRVLLGGLQLNVGAGVVPLGPNSQSFTSNGWHFCQPGS